MVSRRPESHLNLLHINDDFDVSTANIREYPASSAIRSQFSPA